jgi:hypothetical protein
MTAFLISTLLALLLGGALSVVWRERREQFPKALAVASALALSVSGYAWWITHGHEITGDEALISLTDLKVLEVAGSHRVSGVIRNNSADRAISTVPLILQIEQCASPAVGDCQLLHEAEQTLVMSVPPGESRQFVLTFNTPRLPRHAVLKFRVDHAGPRTHRAVER